MNYILLYWSYSNIRKAPFQISSQMTEDVIFTCVFKIINSLNDYLLTAY